MRLGDVPQPLGILRIRKLLDLGSILEDVEVQTKGNLRVKG